jgi:hypothetical protein
MANQNTLLQAIASSAGLGGGGGFAWVSVIKTVADNGGTAVTANEVYGDTSGGAFIFNLPASPTVGMRVRFIDKKGNWNTNNLTIGRNGQNIKGIPSNFPLNVNFGAAEFVFTDSTDGWMVVTNWG